jgi:uncharacterized protein YybS (DUF2232 family)
MTRDIAIGIGLTLLVFTVAVRVPLLGFLGVLFMPLPTLFYRVKLGRQSAMAIPAVGLGVMWTAAGGLSTDLFFFTTLLLLGWVMGELFERRLSVEQTVLAACAVVIAAGAVVLVLAALAAGKNVGALIQHYVAQNLATALELYQAMGMPEENVRHIADGMDRITYVLVRILPAMTLTTLLVVVWANLMMARAVLLSRRLPAPDFGRLNRWQTPEPMVWVVIAAAVLLMIPGTGLKLIGANLLMVMMTVYFFQGIAIVAFYFDRKGVPRPLRIFLYSLAAIQQLLLLLIIALGFFDVWFNFRRLETQEGR